MIVMRNLIFGSYLFLLMWINPSVGYGQALTDSLAKSQSDTTNRAAAKRSKITPGVPSKFDWIKLLDGTEMEVEVRRISEKYVFYSKPGNMDTDWIDRRKVQTIYYRTGGVEQMSSRVTEIRNVKDWREIELTKNASDVEGLIKIDNLDVRLEATSNQHYRSVQALERSAEAVLRRQAALINADIVLITRVNHIRAYGDAPVVSMTGEAYRKK